MRKRRAPRKSLVVIVFALLVPVFGFGQTTENMDAKLGQMVMVGFRGLELTEDNPVVADLRERRVGAVILFDYDVPTRTPQRNIQSADQVKKLTAQLRRYASGRLLIAIDQEGGRVNRLKERFGFPPNISAEQMGQAAGTELTRRYAEQAAKLLADLGINLNFAPVVDVNTNPENPVIAKIERSFSADPYVVTAHAREWIAAHGRNGVLSALKHFPGHGSSRDDSHLGLVDVSKTWNVAELQPYRTLIAEGVVDVVMTAHIFNRAWDEEFPATLSPNVVNGILRNDLKYDGVVVSDDLQMKAISAHYGFEVAVERAVNAGIDILVFGNNLSYEPDIGQRAIATLKNLVASGKIKPERVDESYHRIMKLKAKLVHE